MMKWRPQAPSSARATAGVLQPATNVPFVPLEVQEAVLDEDERRQELAMAAEEAEVGRLESCEQNPNISQWIMMGLSRDISAQKLPLIAFLFNVDGGGRPEDVLFREDATAVPAPQGGQGQSQRHDRPPLDGGL